MTDELTRRGYEAELNRHRLNLARALDETQRVVGSLDGHNRSGSFELADEAHRLLSAVGDVVRAAAALSAANQLSFTVEDR